MTGNANNDAARATREQLYELWAAVLNEFRRRLERPEGLKASYMSVIVAFLRDNGININSMQDAKSGLDTLADQLRELDEPFAH